MSNCSVCGKPDLASEIADMENELSELRDLLEGVVYYAKRNPVSSPQCIKEVLHYFEENEND